VHAALQIPPPGGGEQITVSQYQPPPVDAILTNYLPFLAALVVMPLLGLLGLWVYGLLQARRGRPLMRPDSTLYNVYLIGGYASLLGGALLLYKFVVDYVYGYNTGVPWRYIYTYLDMEKYMFIADLLTVSHFLAGLGLGLTLLLVYYRRTYENWWADLIAYAGNLGLYLYLSTRPLQRFYFAKQYIDMAGIPPGTRPYDLVAPRLIASLALGLLAGGALTAIVIVVWKRNKRGGGGR